MYLPSAKKKYWPTLRVAAITFVAFFLYAAIWQAGFPIYLRIPWAKILLTSAASGLGGAAIAIAVCWAHNRHIRRRKLHDALGIRVD